MQVALSFTPFFLADLSYTYLWAVTSSRPDSSTAVYNRALQKILASSKKYLLAIFLFDKLSRVLPPYGSQA